MESREVRIKVPDGYEIDRENSTFECIKFKRMKLTYDDVEEVLFRDTNTYFLDENNNIYFFKGHVFYRDPTNATSKKQLEKLLAINKLLNVAKYLNGDWKPIWSKGLENVKYSLCIDSNRNVEIYTCTSITNAWCVYFRDAQSAQQAIDILGEETIRFALSTDW